MRIAICEDIPEETRRLMEMIGRYLETNSLEADVEYFESGEDFLPAFEPGKYQIIFMDIFMRKNGLTGMEVAEKVSRADREAAIIFVTTSKEFFLDGYSFAVFYITKPYDYEKLAEAMDRCWIQIERYAKTIEVVVDRRPRQIRLRDIYSVESLGRTCVFRTASHELTAASLVIDGLADRLGESFVMCHRSYIVNLLHVKEIASEKRDKIFIMENGDRVPISRTYLDVSQKAFREFFWKRIQGDPV